MKNAIFTLIALTGMACSVQQPISRADIDPVREEALPTQGIFYYLPKTVIKVEVRAQKKIVKPGPFYRYSQRYLNLSDVITEDKEEWTITGAHISTKSVPDAKRMFGITTQGSPSAALVSLTPEGILRGINLPPVVGKNHQHKPGTPFVKTSSSELFFDDVPFTEEQLLKTSTAAMAEEAAKEIYRLRDAKRRLLESEAQILPPDKGAYQTVLEQLEIQEQKFLSLFKGKIVTSQMVQSYDFVPDTLTKGNQVLFRFSAQKGFVDPMDVSGTPVYIEVKAPKTISSPLSYAPTEKGDLRRGLVYCIPAPARVKIIDRTLLLTEADVNLGQFGQLRRLPASLLDNPGTSLLIDPLTGALIQIISKPEAPVTTK
jgi:hypothetical protein